MEDGKRRWSWVACAAMYCASYALICMFWKVYTPLAILVIGPSSQHLLLKFLLIVPAVCIWMYAYIAPLVMGVGIRKICEKIYMFSNQEDDRLFCVGGLGLIFALIQMACCILGFKRIPVFCSEMENYVSVLLSMLTLSIGCIIKPFSDPVPPKIYTQQDMDAKCDEVVRFLGLRDPFQNNEPISSLKQLEAYIKQRDKREIERKRRWIVENAPAFYDESTHKAYYYVKDKDGFVLHIPEDRLDHYLAHKDDPLTPEEKERNRKRAEEIIKNLPKE